MAESGRKLGWFPVLMWTFSFALVGLVVSLNWVFSFFYGKAEADPKVSFLFERVTDMTAEYVKYVVTFLIVVFILDSGLSGLDMVYVFGVVFGIVVLFAFFGFFLARAFGRMRGSGRVSDIDL